jgi:HK97 family phage major capsid protein
MESTIKHTSRSLLDPIPRSMKSIGVSRDTFADEGAPLPGTYRHYQDLMRKEFRNQPLPTFADVMVGAYGYLACFDTLQKQQIGTALTRTMTGISGSSGGFAIAAGMSEDILDRARMTVGPWSLCNWERVENRECYLPVTYEASRANGQRWGGMTATWGYGETALPPPADAMLSRINTVQNQLLIYTTVSRDLFADSGSIGRWIKYVGLAEIRAALEWAMILGNGSGAGSPCPMGAAVSPATVVIARATGGAISVNDVNSMWRAIYGACQTNAVWHCSPTTVYALDALNTAGQGPPLYYPAGTSPIGTPYATIKGRPLIPIESCPALGTAGDLICVDWTQYALTYLKLNPTDSPLAFDLQPPRDGYHRGIVGLREDAVESRISTDRLFELDELAIVFKLRGDGNFLWPNTMTVGDGTKVGPASVLSTGA